METLIKEFKKKYDFKKLKNIVNIHEKFYKCGENGYTKLKEKFTSSAIVPVSGRMLSETVTI